MSTALARDHAGAFPPQPPLTHDHWLPIGTMAAHLDLAGVDLDDETACTLALSRAGFSARVIEAGLILARDKARASRRREVIGAGLGLALIFAGWAAWWCALLPPAATGV